MIGVIHKNFNNIPALEVVDVKYETKALPVVIYFHGFTSAKEHNLPLAYLLAAKGYRVVLPDSEYHGEREIEMSAIERQVSFWDIVMQNIKELKEIRDTLTEQGLLLDGRIGIAGTSMGGITTSVALTQYPWIKVAAILMGSPKITVYAKTLVDTLKKMGKLPVTDDIIDQLYQDLKMVDLSLHPEKLNQRPLLFWHGENDSVVPFDHSYTFYEDVKHHYTNQDQIQFMKEANRDHKVSRKAILATEKWFETYL
ncbi:alpha/beta fold hydrolase [Lentibacillus daqui]|uniref:alpha/beta fold hydrolase n=1 Tax=Lentibacillus daqui TaxID=2911514 RepID=UPI0022B1DC97|nr:alpha/beta fold hydrolase [Lentibacillus daqui]